mgnify:CR=1 FL=1
MKPRSMEEKISYLLFLMGFAGLACTAALCIFVFHKAFREQAWTALEREADLVAVGCAQVDAPSQLETYVDGSLRITLIASDGSVLFESATNQPMENHLSRPEIQQAMKSGVGRDCRDSQTLGYETYYYAMLLTNGDILRVAQDSETIWSIYDAALPAIVLSCFLMMGAAAIIAGLLTKSLVQPVLKMTDDLDHIQENVPYKELIPFAESIHSDRMLRENNEKNAAGVHGQCQPRAENASDQHLRLCRAHRDRNCKTRGYAGFCPQDPCRGQPDDTAGQRYSAALPPRQCERDGCCACNGNGRSAGCGPRVRGAPEGQRPALLYLPDLPWRERPCGSSRSLLDELCQNLCDNAIRYNRPGGKVQIITACTRDGHCTLTVKDNGIGIPKEAQTSVFERFYRGGQEPQQSHWRHRSGSGYRQTHRPHPQRPHQAGQRCGRGYHHHRDLRNGFLTFHEFHVCPNFRADVFFVVSAK